MKFKLNWSMLFQILTVAVIIGFWAWKAGSGTGIAIDRVDAHEIQIKEITERLRKDETHDAGFESMVITKLDNIESILKELRR